MYSPFEKTLSEIETIDLSALRAASEGWYIEYKRGISNPSDLAKTISSFSNTYGGWAFYGIEEKSKDNAVAGAFPGILIDEIDAALQRLRQAVAILVSPSPHFDPKILRGPCEEIGLNEERAILCVFVPQSPNTPHVHKSGKIYRRVADGSEPKAENDRFILDQLWRRGDDVNRRISSWVDREPEFSDAELERPYLRLLLAADLWKVRDLWLDVSLNEIRSTMGASTGTLSRIPFENIYTSSDGFIARQIAGNKPDQLGLTWFLRYDLRSEILIPLNSYRNSDSNLLHSNFADYKCAVRYLEILLNQKYEDVQIIDLNFLFNVLTGILNTRNQLSAMVGWDGPISVKAQLLNVWRTCAFIDIDVVLDEVEQHGIPLCLNSRVDILPGSAPNTFVEIPNCDEIDTDENKLLAQSYLYFELIARAFGVPEWKHILERDPEINWLSELINTGLRAATVQDSKIKNS